MEADTQTGVTPEAEWPEPLPSDSTPARRGPWWTRPVVMIVAVTALAGGLRFYHLSAPHEYVFDEIYYAKDGCLDAGFPYKECKLDSNNEQTFTVHPPLGRWMVAGGVAAFGNRPFGWRFSAAVAGTISVLLTAILAYLLFGTGGWAGVGGLLLATESLNFVQSRISMLDIFLTMFVMAGFLFLVLDRRWIDRRTPAPAAPPDEALDFGLTGPTRRPPSPIFRPWRLATGVAFGAAMATKWSGAPALLAAILLAMGWEAIRRKRAGLRRWFWEAVRDEAFGVFLFLLLVPFAVYLASYARYFVDQGFHVAKWYQVQRGMAEFSIQLRATHPYASRPWTWPLLYRPVSYFYKGGGPASAPTSAEILGIGNPAIFWGGLVALVWTLMAWFAKRDWRGGLIVMGFAVQYFLWFFAARTAFLFYMTPITPFLVLACVYGLKDMWEARIGETRVRALAPLAAMLIVAAVGMFIFFFPILTGRTISYDAWRAHMWFRTWI